MIDSPPDFYVGRPWKAHYPPGVPAEIEPDTLPALDVMCLRACEKHASRLAYRDTMGGRLTYAQLAEQGLALARWLVREGVLPGDRVALMLPNVLAFPVAVLGALFGRFVVTCLNPQYTAREALHQLRDSGARVLVILDQLAGTIEPVLADYRLERIVVVGDGGPEVGGAHHADAWARMGAVQMADIVGAGSQGWRPPEFAQPEDIAVLQYTGGTTGVSKGAMLRHRNLAANSEFLRVWLQPWCMKDLGDRQLVMIAALPLYHIYALMCCLVLSVRLGSAALLIRNARNIDALIDDIKDARFHILWGVNATYASLVHHARAQEIDFSSLRLSCGGGSAMQAPIAQAWRRLSGQPVIEGYGLSETSPTVTLNPLDDPVFSGTVGYPMPSLDVSLRDEHNRPVAVGERGEVCVRGPTVMAGYWQRPDETAAAFTPDGYLKTGDVGTMSTSGRLSIVDRLKDMVLVSGFNVYPNEVEGVLAAYPGVVEVAVVGAPDERSGERLVAYVVSRDPQLKAEDLIRHARTQLVAYKVPREVIFRAELPKTTVGKILRRSLRDEQRQGAQ